jgi:hypothetical protein
MSSRSIAACCCAAVAYVVLLAPVDADARARGGAVMRAPAPRVSVPPRAARPMVHAGRTGVVRAGSKAGGLRTASHSSGSRAKHLADSRIKSAHGNKHHDAGHDRRFRRHFGRHLPVAGIGIWYGPLYEPGFYNPGYYAPVQQGPVIVTGNDSAPVRERVAAGGRCRSHAVVVPSEAGGERKVTVTECNLP